jgi:hypothetical protein
MLFDESRPFRERARASLCYGTEHRFAAAGAATASATFFGILAGHGGAVRCAGERGKGWNLANSFRATLACVKVTHCSLPAALGPFVTARSA